jgi:hypothetical protein
MITRFRDFGGTVVKLELQYDIAPCPQHYFTECASNCNVGKAKGQFFAFYIRHTSGKSFTEGMEKSLRTLETVWSRVV